MQLNSAWNPVFPNFLIQFLHIDDINEGSDQGTDEMRVMRIFTSVFNLAVTAAIILMFTPFLLGVEATEKYRSKRRHIRMSARLLHYWASCAVWALGIKTRVKGRPAGRDNGRPVFFTSNHMGYMDIVILASVFPFTFISKKEAGDWPLLGPLIRSAGTLFVDRADRAGTAAFAETTSRYMGDGADIMVFPEGTSTNGEQVLPFKSSLFVVPVKTGAMVQPVTVNYLSWGGETFSKKIRDNICWYGDMTLAPHLWNLLSRRGLRVEITFGPVIEPDSNRKTLALEAHERVARAFRPVTD